MPRMLDDQTRLLFATGGVAELPLQFAPQVLRCVAAGPGGHPLTVLLDTGTDPSAIDLGLARRLGLRLGEFALGSDAVSDAVPFTETVLPWLRLGDLTLRDIYLSALDLRRAPFPVDLVLGYNILCHLTLGIDYRRRLLCLSHPDIEPPAPSARGVCLPLRFAEHFPALEGLRLNGAELPLATIDTGSNGGLTLSADLAERLDLRLEPQTAPAGVGQGFAGGRAALRGAAATLQIGPFALADVPIDTPAALAGDLARAGRANLGNQALARFARVTLDYRRGICLLEP